MSRAHMQKGESSRRHEKQRGVNWGRDGPRWAQADRPSPFRAYDEKTPDGRETFKIIVKASGHVGQGSSAHACQQPFELAEAKLERPGGDSSQIGQP
jgi:hypothetical protein